MARGWRELADRGALLLRTARHLRWEQLVYRPVRLVQKRLPVRLAPSFHPRRAGDREPLGREVEVLTAVRGPIAELVAPSSDDPTARARAVLAGEFRFLGHAERFGEVRWDGPHPNRLWGYHLHYFDYALDLARAFRSTGHARYARRFEELTTSWLRANPPGRGTGWEPYPVSVRIVNWIYALLLFGDELGSPARTQMETSLADQAEYLSHRVEYHVLGNHLVKNMTALVVAGLYFGGRSPARWLRRGTRGLWRQVLEQVLTDGVHYERSPMYHAIVLGDLLETLLLLDAAGEKAPPNVLDRVGKMVEALGVLSRPDGRLHLFNDAAHGIGPDRSRLDALALRLLGRGVPEPSGAVQLEEGGYYGAVDSDGDWRLLLACGERGPAYQPGHAHCDLLSFELDVRGVPLVVDPGVCGYEGDPFRAYVRSTRAHNTLMVDGKEQYELWDTFRVARRAQVLEAFSSSAAERYVFEGAYRPYHGRAVHRRRVERTDAGWRIGDRVEGAEGRGVVSHLHLHPAWEVVRDGDRFRAAHEGCTVWIEPFGVDRVGLHSGLREPVQGWYCPEFGTAQPAPVIVMELSANRGRELGYSIRAVEGRR